METATQIGKRALDIGLTKDKRPICVGDLYRIQGKRPLSGALLGGWLIACFWLICVHQIAAQDDPSFRTFPGNLSPSVLMERLGRSKEIEQSPLGTLPSEDEFWDLVKDEILPQLNEEEKERLTDLAKSFADQSYFPPQGGNVGEDSGQPNGENPSRNPLRRPNENFRNLNRLNSGDAETNAQQNSENALPNLPFDSERMERIRQQLEDDPELRERIKELVRQRSSDPRLREAFDPDFARQFRGSGGNLSSPQVGSGIGRGVESGQTTDGSRPDGSRGGRGAGATEGGDVGQGQSGRVGSGTNRQPSLGEGNPELRQPNADTNNPSSSDLDPRSGDGQDRNASQGSLGPRGTGGNQAPGRGSDNDPGASNGSGSQSDNDRSASRGRSGRGSSRSPDGSRSPFQESPQLAPSTSNNSRGQSRRNSSGGNSSAQRSNQNAESNESFRDRFNRILMDAAEGSEGQGDGEEKEPGAFGTLLSSLAGRIQEKMSDPAAQRRMRDRLRSDRNRRSSTAPSGFKFLDSGSASSFQLPSATTVLIWLFVLSIIGGIFYWLHRINPELVGAVSRYARGLNPANSYSPKAISSGEELIRELDRFVLWRFGFDSNWWHNGLVRRRLMDEHPAMRGELEQLLSAYEHARYAPGDQAQRSSTHEAHQAILARLAVAERSGFETNPADAAWGSA